MTILLIEQLLIQKPILMRTHFSAQPTLNSPAFKQTTITCKGKEREREREREKKKKQFDSETSRSYFINKRTMFIITWNCSSKNFRKFPGHLQNKGAGRQIAYLLKRGPVTDVFLQIFLPFQKKNL